MLLYYMGGPTLFKRCLHCNQFQIKSLPCLHNNWKHLIFVVPPSSPEIMSESVNHLIDHEQRQLLFLNLCSQPYLNLPS